MKKKYKYICVILMCGGTLSAMAQRTNEEMSREVIMLREYNPTLADAEKINIEPTIFSVTKKSLKTSFIENTPLLNSTSNKVAFAGSGDSNTNIAYDKQTGYLGLGAGSYGNIEGRAGVRLRSSDIDLVDIWGTYQGSNGNVKYIEHELLPLLRDKNKAKLSDLNIHAAYRHLFASSTLSIGADFRNLGFNYYGSPLNYNGYGGNVEEPGQPDYWNWFDFDSKQSINIMKVKAGLFSKATGNQSKFIYDGHLAYTAFSAKYGYMPSIDKGPRGGIVDADLDLSMGLGEAYVGARGDITYQYFGSKKDYMALESTFSNYLNFQANPYFKMEDINWNINVGLNLNYIKNSGESKVLLSPNIKANIHINEVNTLYLNVLGGVDNNTFVDVINENRYVALLNKVHYSKTPYNIQLGYKSGVIPGLEFDLFGGYKQVKNDHYFINQGYFGEVELMQPYNVSKFWGNVAIPYYYKSLNIGHVGGQINTGLIPMTSLTLRATGYFYSAKEEKTIYGRPSFETTFSADIKPIDPLNISVTYLLQTGRKGVATTSESVNNMNILKFNDIKLNNINELDVAIEYRIIKPLSIYAKVNNLLNQKYELQPGYALQGINVLGGFNLKF